MKTIQTTKKLRNPKGRRKFRPLRLALLGFVAILFTSSGWQLYELHNEVTRKVAQLDQEKSKLLEEKKTLENQIVELNTPSYIEQLAREFGLVKPGEVSISPREQ